jgi:hypothetical protein
MADVLFTMATSQKNQMYTTIINAFIAAGWENISSNAAVDFDVLRSPGESGDKTLTIQLRATSPTNTNSTLTTDYNVASYRLIESYTPGAPGVAGVFGRPTEAWNTLYLLPTVNLIAGASVLTYFINVNKNRMIIVIESPPALSLSPITHYIGLPDITFASEPGSRGLLVASSAYAKLALGVHITNTPGEVASEPLSSTRAVYCQLSPKNPNSAGIYSFSEMKYGSTTEGFRGKLNGILTMPVGGINTGDIINVGAKQFRAIVNHVAAPNTFPSVVLVIQMV